MMYAAGSSILYSKKNSKKNCSGQLRHDYPVIKYAYFDKMLFRTVCFYQ